MELAVLLGLCLAYLFSFDLSSPVNGPYEVFAQDSVYILKHLDQGQPYRWNPQNHLLYHWVVDHGHRFWRELFGPGMPSTYIYLKLFTALCGLAFVAALRWLFVELGLGPAQRCVLLVLAGVTVPIWFHFAAFETHALGLPALALHLVALARLGRRGTRSLGDRGLWIGSLVVCGWTRVDLFRLAAASGLVLLLPSLQRWWRALAVDLALVLVLGVAGSAWLAHSYLNLPLRRAVTAALDRYDRKELGGQIHRLANVTPHNLAAVGRAVSLYSFVMPVEVRRAGRGFLAPPTYELNLAYPGTGVLPSTKLFLEPARNLLGSAISLLTLAGVAGTLLWACALSLRRAAKGDALHALLLAQAATGWLVYTWFNPFEPFLWIAEFLPLWIATIADHSRERGCLTWVLLATVALVVALHNWFAFYVPFR